jgi:hypothetical protein
MNFTKRANAQIDMLNKGKPLEAIDEFFSENLIMYDNDNVFANGKAESRSKQEPYISSAKSINGKITDVLINESKKTLTFRNHSVFVNNKDQEIVIDGLCCQSWEGDYVIEERYYSGQLMLEKIEELYN